MAASLLTLSHSRQTALVGVLLTLGGCTESVGRTATSIAAPTAPGALQSVDTAKRYIVVLREGIPHRLAARDSLADRTRRRVFHRYSKLFAGFAA